MRNLWEETYAMSNEDLAYVSAARTDYFGADIKLNRELASLGKRVIAFLREGGLRFQELGKDMEDAFRESAGYASPAAADVVYAAMQRHTPTGMILMQGMQDGEVVRAYNAALLYYRMSHHPIWPWTRQNCFEHMAVTRRLFADVDRRLEARVPKAA